MKGDGGEVVEVAEVVSEHGGRKELILVRLHQYETNSLNVSCKKITFTTPMTTPSLIQQNGLKKKKIMGSILRR